MTRRRQPDERPVCRCGCDPETHQHWRPGTDCGRCSRLVCPRYRPDLHAVCADNQVIDAVAAGDYAHALLIADPTFVQLLAALANTGRRP